MTNRALLVVDMQNGFCHPDGSFSRLGMGLEGVGAAVRNAAVAVAQARPAWRPPSGPRSCATTR
jgi:nicotinamidase-related amidase